MLFTGNGMGRGLAIAAAFVFLAVSAVYSQDDSTRYIYGLPVSVDDTARQFLQRDLEPSNKLMPVAVEELPEKLREALEEEEQYTGWKDSTIYYEKNTGLYLVPVKYAEGVKVFGLNEDGDPVTFREVTPDLER